MRCLNCYLLSHDRSSANTVPFLMESVFVYWVLVPVRFVNRDRDRARPRILNGKNLVCSAANAKDPPSGRNLACSANDNANTPLPSRQSHSVTSTWRVLSLVLHTKFLPPGRSLALAAPKFNKIQILGTIAAVSVHILTETGTQ